MPKTKVVKTVKPIKPRIVPGTVTIGLKLPDTLVENLTRIATERGVDVPTLIRVAIMNLSNRTRYYNLTSPMGFGKYVGETVETVIRCDPSYLRWMLSEVDIFVMSEPCLDLLARIEDGEKQT